MKAAKLKKKLPPLIYVCGYLRLLAEPMEPTSALAANLWHLADVAQDAAGLPWDNVREWADAMRYYSDCCGKSWHDTQLQQNKQNRIVWFPSTRAPPQESPCIEYAHGECGHKQDHPDGNIIRIHSCPACFYATTRKKGHTLAKCPLRRSSYGNGDSREGGAAATSVRRGGRKKGAAKASDTEKPPPKN